MDAEVEFGKVNTEEDVDFGDTIGVCGKLWENKVEEWKGTYANLQPMHVRGPPKNVALPENEHLIACQSGKTYNPP